jgi:hypothetical protein
MMRYVSWFLSILLHVTVFTVLMQSITLRPMDLEKLMELDLTQVEPADEVISPMPAPPPPPPVAAPVPAPPEAPPEAAPLPMDKTLVLADEPVQPAEPEPEPEPEPGPKPVEISPVKVPVEPEKEQKELPRRIDVRKGDVVVHRGHEARFGRSMMGDYFSYSSSEFSGQFTTRDDRTISIIDARNTEYGRFLIYDSKNKTLRRLKQFAKYVFTIGPSLYEDEPVVGVVTFLAKDDRIERFVLTTDDDRLAHYPRKIHVREDNVTLDAPAGPLAGITTLPAEGSGNSGVVFLSGDRCVDPGLIRGVTRSLAANDLASLILSVRGCDGEQGEPADRAVLARDAGAAVHFLSGNPRLQGGNVGLWGNGRGALVALDAATGATGFGRPDFLVCLLNDSVAPGDMPGPDRLGRLDMPVLWLVTGRKTASWRPFITTLEKLRDRDKRPFTVVLAPLKASGEVDKAQGDLSSWVEQVTEDQSRLATSWIKSLSR